VHGGPLRQLFEQSGDVIRIQLIGKMFNFNFNPFAFIQFSRPDMAEGRYPPLGMCLCHVACDSVANMPAS